MKSVNGSGRTCGSCHPENNNFTIDPKFIDTLPDDDPLFSAEFVPALLENFEKPGLMRKVGLILENTNGFDDLDNNFTMRSVPHLLAMRTSLNPPLEPLPDNDGTTIPPDDRTGWSGDGSPVDLEIDPQLRGTLRDFAVGAVVQHFTIEDAIPLLKEANNKIEREIKTRRNNRSRRLMQDAIVKLDQAREAMIIRSN